jgi:hypothetical protein
MRRHLNGLAGFAQRFALAQHFRRLPDNFPTASGEVYGDACHAEFQRLALDVP